MGYDVREKKNLTPFTCTKCILPREEMLQDVIKSFYTDCHVQTFIDFTKLHFPGLL